MSVVAILRHAKKHVSASMRMQQMQEVLAEQTKAIQGLQQQLQSRDQVIDQLQKRVDTLQGTFTAIQQKLNLNVAHDEQAAKILENNDVADLKTVTPVRLIRTSKAKNKLRISNIRHNCASKESQSRRADSWKRRGSLMSAKNSERSH